MKVLGVDERNTFVARLEELQAALEKHVQGIDYTREQLLELAQEIKAVDPESQGALAALNPLDAKHRRLRSAQSVYIQADTEKGDATASALERASCSSICEPKGLPARSATKGCAPWCKTWPRCSSGLGRWRTVGMPSTSSFSSSCWPR